MDHRAVPACSAAPTRTLDLGAKPAGEHGAQLDVGGLPARLYLVTLEAEGAPPVTAPLTVAR